MPNDFDEMLAGAGSALDEVAGNAVGNARQCPHTAWDNYHGISGIGTAGHVGPDVGVGLMVNLLRVLSQDLVHEVAPAAKAKLLDHDAQGAIGGYEIYDLHPLVAVDREQEVLEK